MKKVLIAAVLVGMTIYSVEAQQATERQASALADSGNHVHKEGRQLLDDADIPVAIQKAFVKSEYSSMTIVKTYTLTGKALEELPALNRMRRPDKLYEVVVEDSSRAAILLYSEEGKLYNIIEKV